MSETDAKRPEYHGQKVAIVGFGLEGESAYHYFKKRGAHITIVDEAVQTGRPTPEGIPTILGPGSLQKLTDFDVVSRTPPISPSKIHTNGRITSVTRLFLEDCPAPVIGVTGTKGKGTTTTLIAEILKSAGKTVHLVGNVGSPALDSLKDINPEDFVAYEMSSFQLWDVEESPETAVVLMIEPDHLDIHRDLEDYIEAKAGIARHQKPDDLMVYHPYNAHSAEVAAKSPAHKRQYLSESGADIRGGKLIIDEQEICSVDDFALPGEHNHQNICAAVTAAWKYTQDVDAIANAIKSFSGLEHRIEFIRELDGVKYYNDSYASAVIAVVAASRAFKEPKIMLMGGKDKGVDYSEVFAIAESANFRKVILFGENRAKLKAGFAQAGFTEVEMVEGGMSDIVEAARNSAEQGDVIILSPGTSSYDMFKNFKQRGESFKSAVKVL